MRVLLVAAVIASLASGCAGHMRPLTPPAAGLSVSRQHSSNVLDGKYRAGGITFVGGTGGLVSVGGFADGSTRQQSWFERSSDGGRTWLPTRAARKPAAVRSQFDFAFASAKYGFAYPNGLYYTTDAGRHLRAAPHAPAFVDAVAFAGTSAWIAGQPCTRSSCASTIYRSAAPGQPLVALRNQPTTTGSSVSLFRLNRSTGADEVVDRHGHEHLFTTTTGGRVWRTAAMPCAGYGSGLSLGGATFWLSCRTAPQSQCLECAPLIIYRSNDLGRSWIRVTPKRPPARTTLTGDGRIRAVSGKVAWAFGYNGFGGTLERTRDGGQTWRHVLTSTEDRQIAMDALAVSGPNTAWVAGSVPRRGGRVFFVYRTGDGGRSWRRAVLPAPSNVATK
jgi:photosystem II stability/assembly factor-like uncharacterized protein